MSFYANSPGMVDDIPKPASVPAPASAPAANLLGDAQRPGAPSSSMGVGPFDKSNMVADIPVAPASASAAAPAPGPGSTTASASPPATTSAGLDALRYAPLADPVMPYGTQVQNEMARAANASGMAPELAAQIGETWTAILHAHGVPDREAVQLAEAGLAVSRGLPDDDTLASWREEASDRLHGEYGGQENAARALALARRYVQAHPALNDYLTKTRIGDHPRVVLAITGVAHRAMMAGKLK